MSGDEGKNSGRFALGNKASKGIGRKGREKSKGLAAEVRKHRKMIVDGLVELAKSGSATARERALGRLADIGWGRAPSAVEMGAIEPVDPDTTRAYGHRSGVVILPAEERETDGLAATLTRLMADGLAKLTDDELVTLERLQKKMNGDHAPLIRRAVTQGLPLTNYTPDAMAPRSQCVAPPASPAIEPQPAPSESPAAIENEAPASPEQPSARVFTLVPPHGPERPWPDGNQDESPLDPGAWGRGRP